MNFKITGDLFLKIAFFLLLLVGILVPSDGGQGLLNPKTLAFVLAISAWVGHLFLNVKISRVKQLLLIFIMGAVATMAVWSWIGFEHAESTVGQFKLFLITILFVSLFIYAYESKSITFSDFLKSAIYTNFAYSIVKVSLALLHALNIVNVLSIMETIGIRFMSMQVIGNLGRLQTSVDILTPFLLYFLLTSESWGVKISATFKRLYIPLAWISIAFSFSRFLLFCAFMAHLMFWITQKDKPFFASLSKLTLIVMMIIPIAGPEKIYTVIERRFFSTDNAKSDDVREEQINALLETFHTSPYVGQGMGGHSKKVIRDSKLKYSYEVQWIAFLMQFGIIGLLLLTIPLLFIFFIMLEPPLKAINLSFFVMFSLWLFAGFTNPFLISLASGIVYALFLGAAFSYRKNQQIPVLR